MQFSTLVVIADAHLGAPRGLAPARLVEFLGSVPSRGDGLLIAGDLFHFWFGTRHTPSTPLQPILDAIESLARRTPVLMVGGNHDRWGSDDWARSIGIEFHRDSLAFAIGNQPALAMHGDQLGKTSPASHLIHTIVGSRLASATFAALPAALSWPLAYRLAEATYDDSPADRARSEAACRPGADRLLTEQPDVRWLVTGHTHTPGVRDLPSGQRHLNPGAWLERGRYAILQPDRATLHAFD